MKNFFDAIEYLFVNVLFTPYDYFRNLELESWFGANLVNWIFMIVGFLALLYWLKELKKFNDNNEEDRDPTAHSFLN